MKVHWYGLMYLFAFAAGWMLARRRAKRPKSGWTPVMVDDFATWVMLGLILGARLGYAAFYDLRLYLADPLEILRVWNGGMSFHGGLLGGMCAVWLFCRRHRRGFFQTADFAVPFIPPGLFFGRLGNFINAELWGTTTDVPWGMVFPGAGAWPRHPSQLYEAALEGVLLFIAIWIYSSKPRRVGRVSGLFAALYALARSLVELVREPAANLGYLAFGWLTMGQVLCLPLLGFGLWLLLRPAAFNAGTHLNPASLTGKSGYAKKAR
jgi:phosphatidylglycerol:prolipoprotein diacylglycerol transferase